MAARSRPSLPDADFGCGAAATRFTPSRAQLITKRSPSAPLPGAPGSNGLVSLLVSVITVHQGSPTLAYQLMTLTGRRRTSPNGRTQTWKACGQFVPLSCENLEKRELSLRSSRGHNAHGLAPGQGVTHAAKSQPLPQAARVRLVCRPHERESSVGTSAPAIEADQRRRVRVDPGRMDWIWLRADTACMSKVGCEEARRSWSRCAGGLASPLLWTLAVATAAAALSGCSEDASNAAKLCSATDASAKGSDPAEIAFTSVSDA